MFLLFHLCADLVFIFLPALVHVYIHAPLRLVKSDNKLTLKECIWLDAVQKHRPITKQAIAHLKERKLIEGRGSDLNISLGVARMTHQVSQYTKNKGLAFDTLKKLILQLAHNAGEDGFKRAEAFSFLENSLPDTKNQLGKQAYLGRILRKMAADELLKTDGRYWFITEKGEKDL